MATKIQNRKLAIIKEVSMSREDHSGKLCVCFSTYVDEGVAASQWIDIRHPAFEGIWEAMKGDVRNLEGKPCWIEDDPPFIRFVMMAKI